MTTKEIEVNINKIITIESFFKETFCIDGKVRMISNDLKNFKIDVVIELSDSKRGKFYIAKVSSTKETQDE